MKRKISLLVFLSLGLMVSASGSVLKSVDLQGTRLSGGLTADEMSTVTDLTVTGTINAQDFKTMRDNMPELTTVNLSSATIEAYTGTGGSAGTVATTYPANEIPERAFLGNKVITTVTYPTSATSVGKYAFSECYGLSSLTVGPSLTSIGYAAFSGCKRLSFVIPQNVSSIGDLAFYDCNSITVDGNSVSFKVDGSSVLFNYSGTKLIQSPKTLPSTYSIPNGVTEIGNYAFYNCTKLPNIDMASNSPSITAIGDFAFAGCSGLTAISIPTTVSSIGSHAFFCCNGFTTIDFSSAGSLSSVGSYAFAGCGNLLSVTLPTTNLTTIGSYAFSNCIKLTTFSGASSLTAISEYLFNNCHELTTCFGSYGTITIPTTVTTVGNYAFNNCKGFSSITFPISATLTLAEYALAGYSGTVTMNNTSYYTDGGALFNNAQTKLIKCPNLNTYTIPSTVTTIGTNAFYGFTGINSVTIPASVVTIEKEAFKGCINLSTVTFDGTSSCTTIENGAFENCNNLSITIPASVTSIGHAAFKGCLSINVATENSNYSAGSGILYNKNKTKLIQFPFDYSVTSVTVPNTVTTIGNSAFLDNTYLQSVSFESSSVLTKIEDYAFEGCINLNSLSIPSTVTTIGAFAFQNCSKWNGQLNTGIITIGPFAFQNCSLLSTTLYDLSNLTSIGAYAFEGCININTVTIPANVAVIGERAFYGSGVFIFEVNDSNSSFSDNNDGVLYNNDITTLIQYPIKNTSPSFWIPSSVTTIENYAFAGCNYLTYITFNDNLRTINKGAFWGCSNIASASSSYVAVLGESAFRGCGQMNYVNFSSLHSCGEHAFADCGNLSSVNMFGDTYFQYSGNYMFAACKKLSSIHASASKPADLSNTPNLFADVDKISCVLYVPAGSVNLYSGADQWKDFVNIVEEGKKPAEALSDLKGTTIYPTLVNDVFKVTNIEDDAVIKLYSDNGKLYLSKKISENEEISIGNLPKGMYIAKVSTENETYQQKIVKQ